MFFKTDGDDVTFRCNDLKLQLETESVPCSHATCRQVYSQRPAHVLMQCTICAEQLGELAIISLPFSEELSDVMEAFEERAAIMEYEGGLRRKEAEQLAWEIATQEKEEML